MTEFGTAKFAISSLNTLVKLLDLLVKSGEKRRNARFEEFIRPLYDSFHAVHLDYSGILRKLERSLPRSDVAATWRAPGQISLLNDNEAKALLEERVEEFRQDRSKQESIRDVLRREADSILSVLEDTNERRLVFSIILYFHENDHRPFPDDRFLDLKINSVLGHGGGTALSTPTTRLLIDIADKENGDEVWSLTRQAIEQLNQRFSDVANRYARLRFELIQNSS